MSHVDIIQMHRLYYHPLIYQFKYGRHSTYSALHVGSDTEPTWNSVFRVYLEWDTPLGFIGIHERELPLENVNMIVWIGSHSSWIGAEPPE